MTDLTAMRAAFDEKFPDWRYGELQHAYMWQAYQAAWNAKPAAQVSEAVAVYQFRQIGAKDWIETDQHCEARMEASPAASCFEYRTLYTHPATEQADVPTSDADRFRFEHTEHDAMARIECKAWSDPASVNNIDWWRVEIDAEMAKRGQP
jgi:hypothetical protein